MRESSRKRIIESNRKRIKERRFLKIEMNQWEEAMNPLVTPSVIS